MPVGATRGLCHSPVSPFCSVLARGVEGRPKAGTWRAVPGVEKLRVRSPGQERWAEASAAQVRKGRRGWGHFWCGVAGPW